MYCNLQHCNMLDWYKLNFNLLYCAILYLFFKIEALYLKTSWISLMYLLISMSSQIIQTHVNMITKAIQYNMRIIKFFGSSAFLMGIDSKIHKV